MEPLTKENNEQDLPKNIILNSSPSAAMGCQSISNFLNVDKTSSNATPSTGKISTPKTQKIPISEEHLLNGILPKLDFNGRFQLTKDTAKVKLDFKGFVTSQVYIIPNKYIMIRFQTGQLVIYSAKNFKEIKVIDFKNAKINCITSNDHKIYFVIDNRDI